MMYGGETIRTAAMLTAQRKKMAEKDVMFLLKLSWVGRGGRREVYNITVTVCYSSYKIYK